MEEEEGGCLAIPARRLVEGGFIPDGRWAGVAVKGMCSHLGDRALAERNRDVLLELATSTKTRVAQLLGEEQVPFTVAVEAPCPPVVSSAKEDHGDPVAAQVASSSRCLTSSARIAGEDENRTT